MGICSRRLELHRRPVGHLPGRGRSPTGLPPQRLGGESDRPAFGPGLPPARQRGPRRPATPGLALPTRPARQRELRRPATSELAPASTRSQARAPTTCHVGARAWRGAPPFSGDSRHLWSPSRGAHSLHGCATALPTRNPHVLCDHHHDRSERPRGASGRSRRERRAGIRRRDRCGDCSHGRGDPACRSSSQGTDPPLRGRGRGPRIHRARAFPSRPRSSVGGRRGLRDPLKGRPHHSAVNRLLVSGDAR